MTELIHEYSKMRTKLIEKEVRVCYSNFKGKHAV